MGVELIVGFYLVTAVFSAAVSAAALRRRREPGAFPTGLMLSAVALWSFASALEYGASTVGEKIIWAKIEYLGIVTAPVFLFLFAIEYNRLSHLLTRARLAGLFAIPAAMLGLVWSNEFHNLVWSSFSPSPAGLNLILFGHGPAFWMFAGYTYLLVSITLILLIAMAVRIPTTYRNQAVLQVFGIMVPVSGNLIYLIGGNPLPGLDPTPIAFCIAGAFCTISFLQFRLFDMVPVARDLLLQTIPDGVIVLDPLNRVADYNQAAGDLLGIPFGHVYGQPAKDVLPDWPLWERMLAAGGVPEFSPILRPEIAVELHIEPIHDRNRNFRGYLILLREITRWKNAQRELHEANEILRTQLDEIQILQATLREQAVRDPLTGLYNRRYLAETLDRELARASRADQPLSVAILDLDNFKDTNDTQGHTKGDEILRDLSDILLLHTRKSDIACRYGGDEFVIIMPGAPIDAAQHRVEQWRFEFQARRLSAADATGESFSCGVACFPQNGPGADDLLKAADLALYEAKHTGRDRIVLAVS